MGAGQQTIEFHIPLLGGWKAKEEEVNQMHMHSQLRPQTGAAETVIYLVRAEEGSVYLSIIRDVCAYPVYSMI